MKMIRGERGHTWGRGLLFVLLLTRILSDFIKRAMEGVFSTLDLFCIRFRLPQGLFYIIICEDMNV